MSIKRDQIEAFAKIGAAAMDTLCIICDERARRRAAGIPLYVPAGSELQFDGDDLDDDQEIYILARSAKNSRVEFANRMKELINEILWYAAENGWEK